MLSDPSPTLTPRTSHRRDACFLRPSALRVRETERVRRITHGAVDIELGALPQLWTPAKDATRPLLSQEIDEKDLGDFLEVIRTRDNEAVDRFVAGLIRRGVTPESILTSLIPPVAREMGERWEDDTCDFVEVTLVLGRLQRLVRSTLRRIPASAGTAEQDQRHQVLLTALPGQQHTLGLLITSHFFRLEGWGVEMGPPFLDGPTADRVAGVHFDVVAFSVATSSSLDDVAREIRQVRRKSRNRGVGILVGGSALSRVPNLVERVGADASAPEARLAPVVARAFI